MFLHALLLAATVAAPPRVPAGTTGDLRVEAGTVVYDALRDRWRVEGGAVLRRGVVVLRARTVEVDPRTGEVNAAGGVLLTDATRAVAAEGLRAVLGGDFEARGVVAFVKDGPVDLGEAATPEEARAAGRNGLSLSADRLRGSGRPDAPLLVDGARLTLCDCGPGKAPSWSLRARSADVIAGDRAILSWPVLYVKSVPVLPLPWLYVPLGERQTGLLIPEVDSTQATGPAFVAPVFVTLGESADLTLSPGWAFGPSREAGSPDPAVRGPMAALELRWAPAEHAAGRAEVTWLHDGIAEPGGASGDRFGLRLRHQQGRLRSLALGADVALDEDGVLHRDLTPGRTARSATYQRASLLAARLAGPAVLEAGAGYLQPLRPEGAAGAYGPAGVDVALAQPLAWASATLPPTEVGPLLASGRGGVARFAPVRGGADLAGRPEASRLDARLQLEAPLLLGGALALSPYVRAAGVSYAGEGGVAWGLAGAVASSELSRAFGPLRHAMGASAEWRLGTPTSGDLPAFAAYDALDRVADPEGPLEPGAGGAGGARRLTAAPPGRFHQARLAVDTRLSLGGATLARLTVGRDADLEAGAWADAFVSAAVAAGPVRGHATVRFPDLSRYGEASAGLAVGEPRGHRAYAEYVGVRGSGSRLQTAGIDVLFDPRPLGAGQATEARAGAQVALGPALLLYQVTVPGRDGLTPRGCGADREARLSAFQPYEHLGRLSWDSPCKCFRAAVRVEVDACGNLTGVKGTLEIARLGDAAAR